MIRKPNCHCSICEKAIYRRPAQIANGNVYCSSKCTGLSQRISRRCKICNEEYVGNKRTCSRTCANRARAGVTYTKENRYNNAYRGAVLKEKVANLRGGVCERCKITNYSILQIHHKKERYRGGTDTLNNLELLCPNCHASHHLGQSLFRSKKNDTVHRRKN